VTPAETAELVAIVKTLYPAQRFDSDPRNVVAAWQLVVADLSLDEARAAVVRLSRRGQQWCSAGDVRTQCARARNVLAPDVERMMLDLREVARREGQGRSMLHPAARRVYDAVGGSLTIRQLTPAGVASLRKQLVDSAHSFDEHVLADELPPAHAAALGVEQRLALEGTPLVDEIERVPMPDSVREEIAAATKSIDES
jgi:hypothetical protein